MSANAIAKTDPTRDIDQPERKPSKVLSEPGIASFSTPRDYHGRFCSERDLHTPYVVDYPSLRHIRRPATSRLHAKFVGATDCIDDSVSSTPRTPSASPDKDVSPKSRRNRRARSRTTSSRFVGEATVAKECVADVFPQTPDGDVTCSESLSACTQRTSASSAHVIYDGRSSLQVGIGEPQSPQSSPQSIRSPVEIERQYRKWDSVISLGRRLSFDFGWMQNLSCEELVQPETRLGKIVTSTTFEGFFSLVITLNCCTMGLEADALVKAYSPGVVLCLQIGEHIFTSLFTIELILRWWVYGFKRFLPIRTDNMWNFLDAVLVIFAGIIMGWLIPFIAPLVGVDSDSSALQTLTIFRSVRLLRVVRVIQKIPMFREAWLLIQGLTDSMRTLFWTIVVIFLITYMSAVIGMWLVVNPIKMVYDEAPSPDERHALESVLGYVGGLDLLIRTLIQFLTLDSWNSKLDEITHYCTYAWVYFYVYISIAVFVLMNLVTAIIVENAMTHSTNEHLEELAAEEKAKQREILELQHLFESMDENGDGTLDWDEFQAAFRDPALSRRWAQLDFKPEECKELFELMDDGDGCIETEEFFYGLQHMKGPAMSRDVVRIAKQVERILDAVTPELARNRSRIFSPSSCPKSYNE